MIFLAVLTVFGAASLVTSALAHDEHRWRYFAVVTAASAAVLTAWTAKVVGMALQYISFPVHPVVAGFIAGTPFAVVMLNLWIRRRRTPRHTPSLNDDPVLRRYLEEKLRRARRRRQAEELEAAADDAA